MNDLISRQAAIDAIRKIYDSVGILGEKWAVDKCQMAIKDLPSAQPETSILTVTVNPDSEEIERVARKIKDAPVMVLPSVQPEIVRCKDCKYGEQDEVGRWFCRSLGCQIGNEDGSGYCADAERRTNE